MSIARSIAQPKPRPTLPSPTPNLGARVGTNLLLLSLSVLSLSLHSALSALKSAIYSGSYTTVHISANSTRIFMILQTKPSWLQTNDPKATICNLG